MSFENLTAKLIGLCVWILPSHRVEVDSSINTDRTIDHGIIEQCEALFELFKDWPEKFVRVLGRPRCPQ